MFRFRSSSAILESCFESKFKRVAAHLVQCLKARGFLAIVKAFRLKTKRNVIRSCFGQCCGCRKCFAFVSPSTVPKRNPPSNGMNSAVRDSFNSSYPICSSPRTIQFYETLDSSRDLQSTQIEDEPKLCLFIRCYP